MGRLGEKGLGRGGTSVGEGWGVGEEGEAQEEGGGSAPRVPGRYLRGDCLARMV